MKNKYYNKVNILYTISILLFTSGISFSISFTSDNLDKWKYRQFNSGGLEKTDMTHFMKNNLYLIILLISGAVTSGITTFINLFYNGLTFGFLVKEALEKGIPINEVILLTLPHGIFEIPAIIIAGAAGFKIPYEIIRYLAGRKETILTKEDIKEYLTLTLISIILIVIAAFVEAYITPRIAEYFLSSPVE